MMTVKNTVSASAAVMTMWLVGVKVYGMMPTRLQNRMNMKIENTSGKKRMPSSPAEGLHHPGDELVGHFAQRLQAARRADGAFGALRHQQQRQAGGDGHENSGIGEGDVGMADDDAHDPAQLELFDRIDRRSRFGHFLLSPQTRCLRGASLDNRFARGKRQFAPQVPLFGDVVRITLAIPAAHPNAKNRMRKTGLV